MILPYALITWVINVPTEKVVSTLKSGILIASFSTVKCIVSKGLVYIKKVPVEKESSHSKLCVRNMLDCRKTSKRNARYYSRDYFNKKLFVYFNSSDFESFGEQDQLKPNSRSRHLTFIHVTNGHT